MTASVRLAASLLLIVVLVSSGSAQSFTSTATITTYAGSRAPTNGAKATDLFIGVPWDVITDGAGGFYFAGDYIVYRVVSDGTIRVIAGTGLSGFSGDGGPATSARLDNSRGLAVDASGNLFIADSYNGRIRNVNPAGIITTVAANLGDPRGVAVDAAGNLFIAEWSTNRIRKVNPAGIVTTVAGNGDWGFSGDGGPAVAASLGNPLGVAVDSDGNLFIGDSANSRVRKVTPSGIITTIAGSGLEGFSGDTGPAVVANLNSPSGVAVDGIGNLFIADARNHRIRKVTPAGIITTVAGDGSRGFSGDGGPAGAAALNFPMGVAIDGAGNVLIADLVNSRIRKVTPEGMITTAAGSGAISGFSGDGGPAIAAKLNSPHGVAVDGTGNLFIADAANERIRKVTPAGIITTVAGNGESGFSGDGGPAVGASLWRPSGVAVDASGNLFIADSYNGRIRKVDPTGTITTVAGNGTGGFSGDGGPATSAPLSALGVAVDGAGDFFVVSGSRIRKVTPAGIITTVAGNGLVGFSGDGGPAVDATLNNASGVAVDQTGNLFIADSHNGRIRKVTPAGIITTFAGDPAVAANVGSPLGVTLDSAGNLFVADDADNLIRKVTAAGIVTTVAGNGTFGFNGDGGPALAANLDYSLEIAADGAGNLFVSEPYFCRIRKVTFLPQYSFSVTDRGGVASRSSGTAAPVTVGYGRIQADSGKTTPSGLAIFGYRQNNVLVSETGVPASPLIQIGRIYAEVSADGKLNTGIAVANPNSQDALITFQISNTAGLVVQSGSFTLQAGTQRAVFLDADPFFGPRPLQGAMSFSSSVPVSVIALRTFSNERDEFLMTTLPVVNTAIPASTGTQVVPHFADGGGFTTHILLVNPSDSALTGTVQFFDPGTAFTPGALMAVSISGLVSSTFSYSVAARSSTKLSTAGTSSALTVGSVRVVPAGGGPAPVPLVVFTYKPGAFTLSEAGVPAIQGNAFRMYVQSSGTPFIQTGFAVANTSTSSGTLTLELTNLDGSTTGLPSPVTRTLPGSGQLVGFLSDFFPANLPIQFRGVLRVSTSTSGISVVGIRSRYNEIGSYLMTTTPPSNELSAPSAAELLFPQIVDGGGFSTEFILFSGTSGQSSSGSVRLFRNDGSGLILTLN